MPSITVNGVSCHFTPGQMILQAALAAGVEIPYYCYHPALSIVASCRICLGEVWAPNRAGKLEPFMGGKLVPTCQTAAADGMVVRTDSPKSVQNQRAVMEYLLINHPLDCPVCDQAGECLLQDYSYQYGNGVSRFQEQKVKNPKKDLGPHIALYADRCIMCTRCVRFAREVAGSGELMVLGRGNKEEIDVFPGRALDNELSGNVADICPVGALLDKDFLFAQRVWFLKQTPSVDGITASGDRLWIEHNEGRVYRLKPRATNPGATQWLTDEVRYGWKFVHSDQRLTTPLVRRHGNLADADPTPAYAAAADALRRPGGRVALLVSPMLSCEEAFLLTKLARAVDPSAIVGVGPVPIVGADKTFPPGSGSPNAGGGFTMYAEKCPNSRGVRRAIEAAGARPLDADAFTRELGSARAAILTGNYPSDWAPDPLLKALHGLRSRGGRAVLIDTLRTSLLDHADVVLPGATWAEKTGTFQNARGEFNAFEAAVPAPGTAKPEGQLALDLLAALAEPTPGTPGDRAGRFDPARVRGELAKLPGFEAMARMAPTPDDARPAMQLVQL